MRNLRRVEKYHPDLMAYYQKMKNRDEYDPKIGFAFVSKNHENSSLAEQMRSDEDNKSKDKEEEKLEPTIVHQPLSEQSQVLWQICERLQSLQRDSIEKIKIPPIPLSGHSNHDRISLPITFEDIKMNVKFGHYDLNPFLFHYNMKIMLDNVVKFWGVNCLQFDIMNEIRDAYKTIRSEMIGDIRRVWEDELLVNAMMDKVVKKPAKNRKKIPEKQDDEDIVNCHCGRFLEEGLMIQCQKCLTWQHVDCAGTDGKNADEYCCIKCEPRTTDLEIIKKDETTAEGHQCYLTLMRGDLQVKFLLYRSRNDHT
jgi:[histone H3]-lysine4 N-trimethyltransferase ASH1L